ncbi:MAG TPA: c-type cytochrome [Candidatus Acidoferrales bacterium]|nr:c-type cytochrome [Candidatus Acidoferrales bacterium]
MRKFIKIFGAVVGGIAALIIIGLVYFNLSFPKAEPVPNIKVELTSARLARGEYLVRHVAGCFDCHSERDWTKFSGPVIPGTEGEGGEVFDKVTAGVPGTVYAKNITPAGIGGWTDGELIRAITTGVSKDGTALFPIMPYQDFNYMRHEDLYSIVAYLRTIKPVESKIPERHLDFPMNLLVKTIPFGSYNPGRPIDKSDSVIYGEYLTTMASCSGCHTPVDKGEPIKGMDFAGGMDFILPAGIVRSANITPDDETGIGRWTKDEFVKYFKNFSSDSSRNIPVAPNEYNTVMPMTSFAGMTEGDLGDIYSYLRTLRPMHNQVVRFTPKH